MSTIFWVLWFFIAFIIVLIAFTLRKENEEIPEGKSFALLSQAVRWDSPRELSSGFLFPRHQIPNSGLLEHE